MLKGCCKLFLTVRFLSRERKREWEREWERDWEREEKSCGWYCRQMTVHLCFYLHPYNNTVWSYIWHYSSLNVHRYIWFRDYSLMRHTRIAILTVSQDPPQPVHYGCKTLPFIMYLSCISISYLINIFTGNYNFAHSRLTIGPWWRRCSGLMTVWIIKMSKHNLEVWHNMNNRTNTQKKFKNWFTEGWHENQPEQKMNED